MFLDVNFHRLKLTRGGSYLPLLEFIRNKKAVINPQNEDNDCFKWAVISSLHNSEIKSNPNVIFNSTKFEANYDWFNLSFPSTLKEIKNFRLNNRILVNVLGFEGKDIFLFRCGSDFEKGEVNFLLIAEDDKWSQDPTWWWHNTLIKSLSRLLGRDNSKNIRIKHFCTNCLQGFTYESNQDNHYSYCINNESVKVEMPTKSESILKFSDGQGQLKAPFLVNADFESFKEPIQGCNQDPTILYTDKVNKHTPSGFCTYSTFAYGSLKNPLNIHSGKDCVGNQKMRSEAHRLYNMFPEWIH